MILYLLQRTSESNQRKEPEMQADAIPLLTLLYNQTQFVIPVFQRDYSWTEAQCQKLLDDVLRVAAAADGAAHFIGSVVYTQGGGHAGFPQWMVIDGQQRLTTCTVLLATLRIRLGQQAAMLMPADAPEAITAQYLVNQFAPQPTLRAKLALRGEDNECLASLLLGIPTPERPHNRVLANATFFAQALDRCDPVQVLCGLRRLRIVSVVLDPTQDNPQLIFESLNSTGLSLTQADLVRNYVLMGHAEPRQTEWYQTYWRPLEQTFGPHYRDAFDGFLRDFLTLELRPPKPLKLDTVYREFRTWYPAALNAPAEADAAVNKLQRLLRFGRYYCQFMFGPMAIAAVEESLARLRKLVDVASPTVMVLLERHAYDRTLTDEDLVDALNVLESYVLRRSVVGAETRSGGTIFSGLAQRIEVDSPLNRMKAALARMSRAAEFPSDAAFLQALQTQDLYGRRNCFYLLERLTNHGRERTQLHRLSIEHVLPQTPNLAPEWQAMLGEQWQAVQSQWLHKLGNLSLTAWNPEFQARPFLEKRDFPVGGYAISQVWLNQSLATLDRWDAGTISARGEMLARRALDVWRPLTVAAFWLKQAELDDAHEQAANYRLDAIPWSNDAVPFFEILRATLLARGAEVVELPQARSVVYRAPDWFAELIPRAHGMDLRLAADAQDLQTLCAEVEDATARAYVRHSTVTGGCIFTVANQTDVEIAQRLIEQTYELMFD